MVSLLFLGECSIKRYYESVSHNCLHQFLLKHQILLVLVWHFFHTYSLKLIGNVKFCVTMAQKNLFSHLFPLEENSIIRAVWCVRNMTIVGNWTVFLWYHYIIFCFNEFLLFRHRISLGLKSMAPHGSMRHFLLMVSPNCSSVASHHRHIRLDRFSSIFLTNKPESLHSSLSLTASIQREVSVITKMHLIFLFLSCPGQGLPTLIFITKLKLYHLFYQLSAQDSLCIANVSQVHTCLW